VTHLPFYYYLIVWGLLLWGLGRLREAKPISFLLSHPGATLPPSLKTNTGITFVLVCPSKPCEQPRDLRRVLKERSTKQQNKARHFGTFVTELVCKLAYLVEPQEHLSGFDVVTTKQQLVTSTPTESSKALNMESAPSTKLLLSTLILEYKEQRKENADFCGRMVCIQID